MASAWLLELCHSAGAAQNWFAYRSGARSSSRRWARSFAQVGIGGAGMIEQSGSTRSELGNARVCVARISGKGRGLVAANKIARDTVILSEPVIVVRSPDQVRLIEEQTILGMYTVGWDGDAVCFPLGLTMLINHSRNKRLCNVTSEHDFENEIIRIRAVRDIAAGEEILFDYEVDDEVLTETYGIPLDA